MIYERFVKQLDGCTYHTGGDNCTCAAGAMLIYRASQGRISMSSCDVRRATGDRVGGTRLEQIQAVAAAKGIKSTTLYKPTTFERFASLIRTGRYGAIIQIDYSPLVNTLWDCFEGRFSAGHAIYVSQGDANVAKAADPGADDRRPDIPRGYQLYPWDLLRRAAGLLQLSDGGPTMNEEYGAGHIFALMTPADPITTAARFLITIAGYTNLYASPNGAPAGHLTRATYVCSGTKVGGLWWYKILTTASGGATSLAGRCFKPNRYTEVHRL